jgi:hypothetical protein
MVELYGHHPSKSHTYHAASLSGKLLNMPSRVFYDQASFDETINFSMSAKS